MQCHSYYGRWNVKDKPKLGVMYLMLDEHINKMVNKEKQKFSQDMSEVVNDFTKSFNSIIKKQLDEIKSIHSSIDSLSKLILKTVDVNKLNKTENKKVIKLKVVSKPGI